MAVCMGYWGEVTMRYRECTLHWLLLNTLRPRQNGRHFPDDIFKCIFLNENVWISLKISLNYAPKGPINNIPALVQIKAWRRPGDKPLSEAMMVSLLTQKCVTRPQWVSTSMPKQNCCLNKLLITKFCNILSQTAINSFLTGPFCLRVWTDLV